jgi:hypothetical protein
MSGNNDTKRSITRTHAPNLTGSEAGLLGLQVAVAELLFSEGQGAPVIQPEDVTPELLEGVRPVLERLLGTNGLLAAREQLVGAAIEHLMISTQGGAS